MVSRSRTACLVVLLSLVASHGIPLLSQAQAAGRTSHAATRKQAPNLIEQFIDRAVKKTGRPREIAVEFFLQAADWKMLADSFEDEEFAKVGKGDFNVSEFVQTEALNWVGGDKDFARQVRGYKNPRSINAYLDRVASETGRPRNLVLERFLLELRAMGFDGSANLDYRKIAQGDFDVPAEAQGYLLSYFDGDFIDFNQMVRNYKVPLELNHEWMTSLEGIPYLRAMLALPLDDDKPPVPVEQRLPQDASKALIEAADYASIDMYEDYLSSKSSLEDPEGSEEDPYYSFEKLIALTEKVEIFLVGSPDTGAEGFAFVGKFYSRTFGNGEFAVSVKRNPKSGEFEVF